MKLKGKDTTIHGKQFLIASSYTAGSFIFLFISIFLICGLTVMTIFNFDTFSIQEFLTLVIFWAVVLLFFFLALRCFWRITVDCKNKTVNIQRVPLKIYYKQIPFIEIKSIIFIEEKIIDQEMTGDFKGYWRQSIKIIGVQDNVLYDNSFQKVINDDLLEKLCREYFDIDYVTIDNTENFGNIQ